MVDRAGEGGYAEASEHRGRHRRGGVGGAAVLGRCGLGGPDGVGEAERGDAASDRRVLRESQCTEAVELVVPRLAAEDAIVMAVGWGGEWFSHSCYT